MTALSDALETHRVATAKARRAFERDMQQAAERAAVATRAADLALSRVQGAAQATAAERKKLWAAHHAMTPAELLGWLDLHRMRLSAYGAAYRPGAADKKASVWHIRMISSELRRRGVAIPPDTYPKAQP